MKKNKRRICLCGHERAHHTGVGTACQYGKGTATGGCTCPDYHTTKRRGSMAQKRQRLEEQPPNPLEQFDTAMAEFQRAAESAIALLLKAMNGIKAALPQQPSWMTKERMLKIATSAQTTEEVPPTGRGPRHLSVAEEPGPPKLEFDKGSGFVKLTPCAQEILNVLATFHPRKLTGNFVAIYTKYSVKSGGFASALALLRKAHFIEGPMSELAIIPLGKPFAKRIVLPTGEKLVEMWNEKLDPCAAMILEYLHERYPETASAVEVSEATRYSAKSGGFASALAKLRAFELIEGSSKSLKLTDAFAELSR